MKSINAETNNTFQRNDSLTAEFYKHLSNKLAPVLLDVISKSYIKKVIKKILQTTDQFHF